MHRFLLPLFLVLPALVWASPTEDSIAFMVSLKQEPRCGQYTSRIMDAIGLQAGNPTALEATLSATRQAAEADDCLMKDLKELPGLAPLLSQIAEKEKILDGLLKPEVAVRELTAEEKEKMQSVISRIQQALTGSPEARRDALLALIKPSTEDKQRLLHIAGVIVGSGALIMGLIAGWFMRKPAPQPDLARSEDSPAPPPTSEALEFHRKLAIWLANSNSFHHLSIAPQVTLRRLTSRISGSAGLLPETRGSCLAQYGLIDGTTGDFVALIELFKVLGEQTKWVRRKTRLNDIRQVALPTLSVVSFEDAEPVLVKFLSGLHSGG